jgi:hypothetical protein
MRKIKDNGRTYKLKKSDISIACRKCAFLHDPKGCPENEEAKELLCGYDLGWRETLPSKLSRLIKRMTRKPWHAITVFIKQLYR